MIRQLYKLQRWIELLHLHLKNESKKTTPNRPTKSKARGKTTGGSSVNIENKANSSWLNQRS